MWVDLEAMLSARKRARVVDWATILSWITSNCKVKSGRLGGWFGKVRILEALVLQHGNVMPQHGNVMPQHEKFKRLPCRSMEKLCRGMRHSVCNDELVVPWHDNDNLVFCVLIFELYLF